MTERNEKTHKNKCLLSHGNTGIIYAVHLLLFNHLIIIFQLATFRLFCRLLYVEANSII